MQTKQVLGYIAVLGFAFLLGRVFYSSVEDVARFNSRSQLALVGQSGTFCTGYGDERDYNYNPLITFTNTAGGDESFIATRRSDGKVLRQNFANEQFYVDKSSGALDITYDIAESCGGVDITYTVHNPTGQNQTPPDLRVEGIMQRTSGDFYLLDIRDTGYLRNIKKPDGSISNIFLGSAGRENTENWGVLTYPDFYYSPVVVAHDNDFAVGTALLYPYLQYKHEIVPQMTKVTSGLQAGTWRHEYKEFAPSTYARLAPSETRTYKITLRFSQPRTWLFTLEGYKKYFKQIYGNVDHVRPIDRRPIYGMDPTSELVFNASTNPRSFRTDGIYATINTTGWTPFMYFFLQDVITHGFERTMIWGPSGLYSYAVECSAPNFPSTNEGQECNQPTAFMDLPTPILNTVSALSQFDQSNVELGFWWGHSSHVPVPQTWDPASVVEANYSNSTHTAFLDNQLTLAHQRGTDLIGLDAFSGYTFDRYTWIDRMKQVSENDIQFGHEGSGSDILHRKIANVVYNPMQYGSWWTQFDKTVRMGPDALSHYINEGAEIWFIEDRPPLCGEDVIEEIASWGYTPLYFGICAGQYPVDLSTLDLDLATCFDGDDDDNDDLTDWPYDPGCDSPTDANEYNDPGTHFTGAGGIDDDGSGAPGVSPSPESGSSMISTGSYSRSALLERIRELQAILQSLIVQMATQPQQAVQTVPVSPSRGPTRVQTGVPEIPSSIKWDSTPNNFSMNMTLGSTGAEVTLLQRFLINRGLLVVSSVGDLGVYGPMTRDAVARLQQFMGLPITGEFDSATRARVNQF